jgi:type VI secretion system secreted protein VgrG
MLDIPFYGDLIWLALHQGPFPDNDRALHLLLGTCAQESGFEYTSQLGGGPAKGYFQCEPATEADVWANFLAYQPEISAYITSRCGVTGPNVDALEHNMVYGILMARTHYFRCDPDPLPAVDDVEEAAHRYKLYYNTPEGAATEQEYIENYERLVKPYFYTAPPGGPRYA